MDVRLIGATNRPGNDSRVRTRESERPVEIYDRFLRDGVICDGDRDSRYARNIHLFMTF